MLGSSILDIAIGLVFVYLLMSLLVTASSELIASWLKRRQDHLWRGIVGLLGKGWADQLYDHPLIKGLTPPPLLKWAGVGGVKDFLRWLFARLNVDAEGPSYIPPQTFVASLLDTIGFKPGAGVYDGVRRALDGFPDSIADARTLKAALLAAANTAMAGSPDAVREFQGFLLTLPDSASFAAAHEQLRKFLEANPGRFGTLPNAVAALAATVAGPRLTAGDVKPALRGVLGNTAAAGELGPVLDCIPDSASPGLIKQEVLTFLDKLPLDGPLQGLAATAWSSPPRDLPGQDLAKSLQTLWDEAGQDPEKFKEHLETWFNAAMDRVSGRYKRETQWVNLVLAVVLTLAINVDTILLVNTLAKNSALRDSLVAQATKFAQEAPSALQPLLASALGTNAPAAATNPSATNELFSLVLSPGAVFGGEALKGIITLRETGPSNLTFRLASSATNLANVPPEVLVPAGQKAVEFVIKTCTLINPARVAISVSNLVVTLQLLPHPQEQFRAARAELDNLNLPIGWVRETNQPPAKTNTTAAAANRPASQTNSPDEQTDRSVASVTASNAPPGTATGQARPAPAASPSFVSSTAPDRNHQLYLVLPNTGELLVRTLAYHWLGWLLTAIAISVGAPFWFDLLDRLMTIRSSGPVPAPNPKPQSGPPPPAPAK